MSMNTVVANRLPLAPISFLGDRVSKDQKKFLNEDDGIIIDSSNLYTGPDTPTLILNHALTSVRKKTAFEQVITEYPSLHKAAMNMVHYFTQLTPSEGSMPLLTKALLRGIDSFNESQQQSYFSNNPAIKMSAFIYGCSSVFHEILFNSVYGQYEDGWVQWKPLTEPIYDWVLRHQFSKLLIVPTSSRINAQQYNAASNKLLFEVFDFGDLSFCGISTTSDKMVASG